jgi:hypothetical protein
MYRIFTIPGFQQGGFSSEYRVDHSTAERIVSDQRSKKPVAVVTICNQASAVGAVHQLLNQLDWLEVIALGKYNTVDDAEQIVFVRECGRVSIPVRYCLEKEGLSSSERKLCLVLHQILEAVESLDFGPAPDSPPSTPRG